MNHPQKHQNKVKTVHAIFENLHVKWPTVSPLLTTLVANLICQAIIELLFTGEFVTGGWLPNILVNNCMEATNS